MTGRTEFFGRHTQMLLRALNIERYQDAVTIVLRYFDEGRIPQKTWCALEELLEDRPG